MARKESPAIADYIVIALSPALIMAMVGSLVFFLIDVLYEGQYSGRLEYTMFFFVIGAVLVARIAIEVDSRRAALYGLFLGGAAWVALQMYLQYPPGNLLAPYSGAVNLILMLIVWWSANKLTWDCTHIDEKRKSSGRGLLTQVGFGGDTGTSAHDLKQADADVVEDVEVVDARPGDTGWVGWWRRYQLYRKRQSKKPHTPGVWVVYFSLAALPLFGLGQSLIPADAAARRSWTFWLMLAYVGSGLGLLLTTSFLGLRRYLRQRGVSMPASMTGLWMMLGFGLIVAFLGVGAFLPRPHSETPLIDIKRLTSGDKSASKYAQLKDGAGKGDGASGNETTKGNGDAVAKGGEPGGKGKAEGKDGSGGKGKAAGNSGDKSDGGKKSSGDSKDSSKDGSKESSQSKDASEGKEAKDADSQNTGQSNSSSSPPSLPPIVEKIAGFMKWILFAFLALLVLAFIFWRGLSWLSNFMPWARKLLESLRAWWQSLFGSREKAKESLAAIAEVKKAKAVPFSAFTNPFRDGSARRRGNEELVRYSFAALEAWGADQGHARRSDETPSEYVTRLTEAFGDLENTAQRMVLVYARLAYATRAVSESQTLAILEAFWEKVEALEPEVVTAE